MASSGKQPFFTRLQPANQQYPGEHKQATWDLKTISKLLPTLVVVENHLHQLVKQPSNTTGMDLVFRTMSGLYRYGAQRGMEDFGNLAFEIAQAFDPSKHSNPEATKRIASLALVAIGQMRRLMFPACTDQNWPMQSKKSEGVASKDEEIQRAREMVISLLTKW